MTFMWYLFLMLNLKLERVLSLDRLELYHALLTLNIKLELNLSLYQSFPLTFMWHF